jgi:hypothetical protein
LKAGICLSLVAILLITTIPSVAAQASDTAAPGQYKITINKDTISVTITTTLDQNLTQLPVFSLVLRDENASYLASILTKSIQLKTPSASVEGTVLVASSNGNVTSLRLQFEVLGSTWSDRWDTTRADLAWRSFSVEDDILVNGVSINLVGKHYLSDPLLGAVASALRPTPLIRTSFQLNGERAIPLEIEQLAPRLNLLDFSSLQTPIDSWSRQFSVSAPSTTWNKEAGFDIVVTRTITEAAGEQFTLADRATYKTSTVLELPGFVSISGDTVYFGQGTAELIMSGLLVLTLAIALGTYFQDRRLTSRRMSKPRKS